MRTTNQGKSIMINAISNDIENRFGGLFNGPKNIWLQIAHTCNEEAAMKLKKELEEQFQGYLPICVSPLSLSVACHIGPGALAIACCKKIEV